MSWATMSWATLAALLLAAISVAVTLSLIDYPLRVAWDELVKLRGGRTGRHAYYHPLFMIDLAVMVFATFSLARLVLPNLPALAAAAATAVTPLLHRACPPFQGGYFCLGLPRAPLLIRLLQEPAPHRAILLGLLVGLAASSKYIGTLILPFAIIAILIVRTPGPERRWLRAATVTGISIGTFLLLMWPAIRRFDRWRR